MNATATLFFALLSAAIAQSSTSCDQGSFFDGVKCTLCPKGTHATPRSPNLCVNCRAGTFNPFEGAQVRSACQPCPADTLGNLEGATSVDDCQKCPEGMHSLGLRGPCLSCPPGEIVGTFGCRPCFDGEISVGNECIECSPGTTAERDTPFSNECRPCPPDHFIVLGRCQLCDAGNVYDPVRGTCQPCPQGFFSGTQNSTSCEPCQQRFFNTRAGSTGCSLCPRRFRSRSRPFCRRIGAPCPSNSIEKRNGDCLSCDAGFMLNRSTETCDRCPEGYISNGGTATECSKCPSTFVGVEDRCRCPPGREFRNGTCSECPPGTGGSFGVFNERCFPCRDGTHAPGPGTPVCIPCPPGTVSEGGVGSTRCITCPNGTVSDFGRPPSCVVPITGCPSGFLRRRFRCLQPECPEGTFRDTRRECISCSPGFRFVRRTRRCVPCPTRAVSPGGLATRCEMCPNGFVGDIFNRTRCVCEGLSAAGFELVDGRCEKCGPGMFNDGHRLGSPTCIPCPEGTTSQRGRVLRTQCSFCRSMNTVVRNDTCVRCPSGTFSYSEEDNECHPVPA